jgi:hypothetical protein
MSALGIIRGWPAKPKILLVAALWSADLAPRLSAVIDTYKMHFCQQSVGLVTREACAAF